MQEKLKGKLVGDDLHKRLLYSFHFFYADLNLFDVLSALEPVSFRWKGIGLALGVNPDELNVIEVEKMKLVDRLTEVVSLWLRKEYDVKKFEEPSWHALGKAVANRAGGNDTALGEEIINKYTGNCRQFFLV